MPILYFFFNQNHLAVLGKKSALQIRRALKQKSTVIFLYGAVTAMVSVVSLRFVLSVVAATL